ncbi:Immunoglobulin superfamily DCC subclass member 3 [Varanus komodoensis]|nr:Immunoglobulin superfamily DCC subclass member 3 [Varanus komodoensis]
MLPWCSEVSRSTELAFTLEPSDCIAVQEEPLALHCQVGGIPPISITWRRNGVLVADGEDSFTLTNGSLYFSRFQRLKGDGSSDEGDYDCMAQNRFGLVVSRKARIQAASLASRENKVPELAFRRDISIDHHA